LPYGNEGNSLIWCATKNFQALGTFLISHVMIRGLCESSRIRLRQETSSSPFQTMNAIQNWKVYFFSKNGQFYVKQPNLDIT
jgi:hypothetical protein